MADTHILNLIDWLEVNDMNPAESLLEQIENKTALVGVIGLGYVGLPLISAFAKAGFPVIGFDIDPLKVEKIRAGESYIKHIPASDLLAVNRRGQVTSDFSQLDRPDCLIICVPTPLTPQREPDMTFIEATAEAIAQRLRVGQLIVLESTTYPGTTREVILARLEKTGLKGGQDFFLAFSPEREDPGNGRFSLRDIPKVVGALSPEGLKIAQALYDNVVARTVPVSTLETAEAVKLLENIFRSVNIALVNELKIIFDRMGLDVWEVIEAAKTKPFGFMPFYPGPGLGGHCIPIDPFYLTWKAREFGVTTRFIELAGEINTRMPEYVVEKLARTLNDQGRSLKGCRILILGVAYKRDVDDKRESPSLRLMELLEDRGAEVEYHDPYVPTLTPTRKYNYQVNSVALTPEKIRSVDAVLLATDHGNVDYKLVAEHASLIVDTRNAMAKVGPGRARVVKA